MPHNEIKRISERQQRYAVRRSAALETAHEPATTTDGRGIEVVANIVDQSDAEQVIHLGGEGVGLLRSEFLFMSRAQAPTEDEQFEAYSTVARKLGQSRPLIIRTLATWRLEVKLDDQPAESAVVNKFSRELVLPWKNT